MNYFCLEELQVDLDLYMLDKIDILSKVGCQCNEGWFVITDDGHCHLFDKDGNLDDIKKIMHLKEEYIRKDITKIVIPNEVIDIEEWAFAWCTYLTNLTIPDSVISIGHYAFAGCRSLTSVMIGNGVMSIGVWTFLRCDKLTNLTFKGKTLKQVKKMSSYPWGIKDKSIIKVK